MTNWQSWKIWENSLHMLKERTHCVTLYPPDTTVT